MFLASLKKNLSELNDLNLEELIYDYDISKLEKYYNFLLEKNQEGGFFSKKDEEKILQRHFLEPIIYIEEIRKIFAINTKTKIADIGTGPGIPGYFFSCLYEPPEIFLIDSQIKRLKLLKEFHEKNFDLKVNFIFDRVENCKLKNLNFIFMRSTIPYPWSAELIFHLIDINTKFIPFLAKNKIDFGREESFLNNLGFSLAKEIDLKEKLNFLGERRFKVIEKKSTPKKNFPRKWEKISKEIKELNG